MFRSTAETCRPSIFLSTRRSSLAHRVRSGWGSFLLTCALLPQVSVAQPPGELGRPSDLEGAGQPVPTMKVELHVLPTLTLTDEEFLTGSGNGEPTTITAALRIPATSAERVPAIVMLHGSLGISSGLERWSRELNDLGIATLMVDSFTGRGIVDTRTEQSQLGMLTTMYDAYRALELLAKHPRIDRQRIGILGGSRGGGPALYSSMTRFQRMYAEPGTRFAVHLVFYTSCNTTYVGDTDVGDAPIRLFHGTADDAGPLEPCRAYVERLQNAGKDVQLYEYAGAHHGFDNVDPSIRIRLEQGETPAFCVLREEPVGRLVNVDTGQPFTYRDSCVRRGVTLAGDAAARAAVVEDVKRSLAQVFGSMP